MRDYSYYIEKPPAMSWRKVAIIARDALGALAAVIVLLAVLAVVNRIL